MLWKSRMNHSEGYVKRIIKVLIYIEDHFEEEMTREELAKVCDLSPFYFHRIFHKVVGEPVNKYVRRLRLERAAMQLRYTAQPITTIAMDSQYDTPSAFTRAFKQAIGHCPKHYRSLYKEVNAMSKTISDLPSIEPDKIEKIGNLDLFSIRRLGKYAEAAGLAWHQLHCFIAEAQLDQSQQRYIGIPHDDPSVTSEEKLRYDACILAPKGVQATGEVSQQTLKGGKCAIFTLIGSYDGMDEIYDRIFLKWLPDSKESFDDTRPSFHEYFNCEFVQTDPSKLITKIYIPIR